MSGVNVTILEGGKAENFGQVTKLRTSNGTDHDLWVPKTDVETKHLSVKKNGLYYTNQYEPTSSEKKSGKAYDIYGWDTITVSVKKKVTGKKRKIDPSTGLETDVPVTVDIDDDGNIVEKELPVRIKIVKEPTTTHYVDGQSISIAGIKVKAYLHGGEEWGDVPFDELSFEPTVAHNEGGSSATSDLNTGAFTQPIPITKNVSYASTQENVNHRNFTGYIFDEAGVCMRNNDTSTRFLAAGKSADAGYTLIRTTVNLDTGEIISYSEGHHNLRLSYEHQGKTVYYVRANAGHSGGKDKEHSPVVEELYGDDTHLGEAAWTIIYGDVDGGDTQEVTVSWLPDDLDEELTDTYTITVGQGPIPPNA